MEHLCDELLERILLHLRPKKRTQIEQQEQVLHDLARTVAPTLRWLEVSCAGSRDDEPPMGWMGCLSALRQLTFYAAQELPASLTQLTALARLALQDCRKWTLPAGVPALTALRTLRMWQCYEGAEGALEGLSSLRKLCMHSTFVQWPAFLSALAGLTYLKLNNVNDFGGCEHPPRVWQAALAPLTRLRHLDLEGSELRELPPSVAQRTALTALFLAFNPLEALPPGPFLASLRVLDVAATCIMRLPGLDAAPGAYQQLQHLAFGDDLSADDVAVLAAQLRRMPRLKTLVLWDFDAALHGEMMRAAFPALQVPRGYRLGWDPLGDRYDDGR